MKNKRTAPKSDKPNPSSAGKPSVGPALQVSGEFVEFSVKVAPGASRTRITGLWGDSLRIALAAPPEGGKANRALCEFLAEVIGVRASDVTIIAGQTSPQKRVRVRSNLQAVQTKLSSVV